MYSKDNNALASNGYIKVTGYVILNYKSIECSNDGPCTENTITKVKDLVKFHITKYESDDFSKALVDWGYTDNIIELGCREDDSIYFTTSADEYINNENTYLKTISLNKDISKKILNSTETNQVTLKLYKNKLTNYVKNDNECSSKFNGINVFS